VRGLGGYVAKRIALLIPVLLGVTFLIFVLLNVLPGGSVLAILGTGATGGSKAELAKQLGLNHPFFYRYLLWLWHALHGDLGTSFITRQPVASTIFSRFPVSFELVVLAMFIGLATALPAAIFSARHPQGIVDWIVRALGMFSLSTPGFVVALYLLLFFAVKLKVFPVTGFVPLSQGLWANLRTMALPAITMSLALFGTYTRILRGDMIDQLVNEDYVLTARSKGVPERRILVMHVFKNSLFSLITIVGAQLGTLLGGAAIIETLFGLPGIGQLLLTSINTIDTPVVIAIVVIIAIIVVMMNLLTDLAYMMLDPRVKYGNLGS
jgi:peptide/nickel transport system permease protein